MCTTVAKYEGGLYFGRNMDIDGDFGESVRYIPAGYTLSLKQGNPVKFRYAFMGMGADVDGYPLMADGMNEAGLCAAALNFVGNAFYFDRTAKKGLAPYELIPMLLGTCSNIREARDLLDHSELVRIPFSDELPLSELHFHVADESGSLCFEQTAEGARIYENTVGVLANNPPFPWQLERLSDCNYIKNEPSEPVFRELKPYTKGLWGTGLPGDFSSPSRFVRAAHLLRFSKGEHPIYDVFSLLNSVAVPKGAVRDESGKLHYTTYQCCMDAAHGVYYCRKYGSLETEALRFDCFKNATH